MSVPKATEIDIGGKVYYLMFYEEHGGYFDFGHLLNKLIKKAYQDGYQDRVEEEEAKEE